MKEKWNVRRKKGYLKIHSSGKCEDQEENSSFQMNEVTDDEHVHEQQQRIT